MVEYPGQTHRHGFTLIEVLVMLLLVVLLAAAVFPVVTQRVSRAEPVKAAHDLARIRSAIEAFGHDLRPVYAGDIEDLVASIGGADQAIVPTGASRYFTQAESARWNGPYLDSALHDGGALMTGFGVPIRDDFTRFDGTNNAPDGSAAFDPAGTSLFVAVQLGTTGRQLSAAQFEAINDLVDGEAERDGPGVGTSWTLGRVRFDSSLLPADSIAYYLAVPIAR